MPFGCFCSRAVFCFQDLIPKESDSSLGQTGILKFTSYLIKRCLSPEPEGMTTDMIMVGVGGNAVNPGGKFSLEFGDTQIVCPRNQDGSL